jgi:hypothetical protein
MNNKYLVAVQNQAYISFQLIFNHLNFRLHLYPIPQESLCKPLI